MQKRCFTEKKDFRANEYVKNSVKMGFCFCEMNGAVVKYVFCAAVSRKNTVKSSLHNAKKGGET
ncbi:MAG: hypothetical protein II811_02925 [Spirochaetaceae bacterium]|nr:hypothetical protein [Spirochaetaceae bacterium]